MTHRSRKTYFAGNWKMNLDRARSLDLIKTIKGRLSDGGETGWSSIRPWTSIEIMSSPGSLRRRSISRFR